MLKRIPAVNRREELLFFSQWFRYRSLWLPSGVRCGLFTRIAPQLGKLGRMIRGAGMRISMHPSQFVSINALRREVVEASVRELEYQALLLDAMGLGQDARSQIHVGGVYKAKPAIWLAGPDDFKKELRRSNPAPACSLRLGVH